MKSVFLALMSSLLTFLGGCASVHAPQIKQASVNGVTLVYQEQGDGAPVVFVHGCCTDYRAWDAQRQAIAQHYRFIAAQYALLRDSAMAVR